MGYGSMAFKAVVEWSKGKNLYLNSADGKGREILFADKNRLDVLYFRGHVWSVRLHKVHVGGLSVGGRSSL